MGRNLRKQGAAGNRSQPEEPTRMCVCVFVYMYALKHDRQTAIHIYTSVCILYIVTQTYMCVYMYIRMYITMHAYMYLEYYRLGIRTSV